MRRATTPNIYMYVTFKNKHEKTFETSQNSQIANIVKFID